LATVLAAILILRSAAVVAGPAAARAQAGTDGFLKVLRLVEDDTVALRFKMRIAAGWNNLH
jgi:hypothetical protein